MGPYPRWMIQIGPFRSFKASPVGHLMPAGKSVSDGVIHHHRVTCCAHFAPEGGIPSKIAAREELKLAFNIDHMSDEPLEPNGLHIALASLLAIAGSFAAVTGWIEALHLDVQSSNLFARPGRPIESGWQPILVGTVSIVICGSIGLGVLRKGFSEKAARLFLALLLFGCMAWTIFGFAGIAAGVKAFPILNELKSNVQ